MIDNFTVNPSSCIFGVKSVPMILYTSDIPKGKFVQVNESCDLFDSSKPVFFMAHGFLLNATNIYSGINFSKLASLLLKRGYDAVFSLDWTNASCSHDLIFPLNMLEYPFAVRNTRKVGDFLARYFTILH
ncbi:PREDICTED: probable phospholipase A1 magnifin [Wasmannia auropunctata]|uniref:probable phospholipase A1 magnifin n=1 Tax=Wasmannia auropunctata TaxID=64793 RepID=UPI0005EF6178|nr:PREDICTED: probable phospholipase A1 magnifin [Wasmannia auropunctata]